MQLKIMNLATVSRKIKTDSSSSSTEAPVYSNNIKDINKMIVMSGTATRKPLEKIGTTQKPVNIIKNQYRENFLKLRTPFYKTRQKQIQPGEKLMSKSCEMIFEYLKPFKHIQIMEGKNVPKRERNNTIGSILKTTNVVYKKTATRRVEISVFEERPNSDFNNFGGASLFDFMPNENDILFEYNQHNPEEKIWDAVPKTDSRVKENFNLFQKTVSSEDFITNVSSEPRIAFI